MSALAKLMIIKGYKVSGSDKYYGREMENLTEWGAKVYLGASEEEVKNSTLVVYNQAICSQDEELKFALKHNIPVIRRDLFLKEISTYYDKVIAVAGTHGKTTVTAMLSSIFDRANALFTSHIGGHYEKGNLVYKGDEYFITEACEYKRSFLSLTPTTAVVLNVEEDHPDTYKNYEELEHAFLSFIGNVKDDGLAIVNADDRFYKQHSNHYKRMLTYAIESNADCKAINIINLNNGCYGFRTRILGYPDCDIMLSIAGYHNIYNALCAFCIAVVNGIAPKVACEALSAFNGVKGRFEYKGVMNGCKVYLDYAHHPTEIKASIATALKLKPKGKLKVVFQPHTLSRTEALFKEFKYSFCDVDELYFLKEYLAREATGGKTAYDLYQAVKEERSKNVYYFGTQLELCKALVNSLNEGDILLVLGAGDVSSITQLLMRDNKNCP
ncbi:MAG: UDP-N-acetylmuramate--L-alanine ligase [Clostridia bacterium]|nr:UDP-N-acetylmuramate--L-alanine ligase [Clostridia bacterium]